MVWGVVEDLLGFMGDSLNCLRLKFGELFFAVSQPRGWLLGSMITQFKNRKILLDINFRILLVRTKIDEEFHLKFMILADFGGLLGLFMGCSLLSIVELIFYCCAACFKRKDNGKINLKNMSKEEFDRLQ